MAVALRCMTTYCSTSPTAQAESVVRVCRKVKPIFNDDYNAAFLDFPEILKLNSPPCVRRTAVNFFVKRPVVTKHFQHVGSRARTLRLRQQELREGGLDSRHRS